MKEHCQIIARKLYNNHYNYYCTVYFDFIVEAVENSIKDFGYEIPPLDDIHKHIKENYL